MNLIGSNTGLAAVCESDLLALVADIDAGRLPFPLTEGGFVLRHLGHMWPQCRWMTGLGADAVGAVVRAVLAERVRNTATQLSLVWTGPEAAVSRTRDTAVVVKDLFYRAKEHVIVGGYSFDHGSDILQPLHGAMRDRGVKVQLFLDLGGHADTRASIDVYARASVERFLRENWPFGPPHPTVLYNPEDATPGHWSSMHAKCIVVDDRFSLITSANFTNRGHNRNIEAGVLIDDPTFATEFATHWRNLVALGIFRQAQTT